jgi:RNA-directed DNA polymerase
MPGQGAAALSAQLRSFRIHLRTGRTRGWVQYDGAFYRSALHPLLKRINAYLMRWLS